ASMRGSTGIYEMMSARKANPSPASSTTTRRPSAVCGRTSPRPRVKKVVPLPYRVVPKPAPPPVATNGALRPHRSSAKPPINPVGPRPEEEGEHGGTIEPKVGLGVPAAPQEPARGAGPQVPGRPDDQAREPRPVGHPPWQHDSLEGIQQHHTDQHDTDYRPNS